MLLIFFILEIVIEKVIFGDWNFDDIYFINIKVCKEVEKVIKSRNFVVVIGYLGFGKFVII